MPKAASNETISAAAWPPRSDKRKKHKLGLTDPKTTNQAEGCTMKHTQEIKKTIRSLAMAVFGCLLMAGFTTNA
ncbi:MAG: hypothetical protein ACKJSG_07805, partial [Lentisphaeria bacterium]